MRAMPSPLPQVAITTAAMQAGVAAAQPAAETRYALMAAEVLALSKRLNSALVDAVAAADAPAIGTGKGLLEVVTSQDVVPTLMITKTLTDVVASLDLIDAEIVAFRAFGETTASLDARFVSVIKTLTELCTTADAAHITMGKQLTETVTTQSHATLATTKGLHDLVAHVMTRVMALVKGLKDAVAHADVGTLYMQSYAADATYFAEGYAGSLRTF